jgi:hypothetical protein
VEPPACPTCGQPATKAFSGVGWECRNEACPEFGQALRDDEPPVADPSPGESPEAEAGRA